MPALKLIAKLLTMGTAISLLTTPQVSTATVFGPTITPRNPYIGQDGVATMHGDPASSDTTPFAGPGNATITSNRRALQSACPTLLGTADGYVFGLCTTIFTQTPTIHLFDSQEANSLAELAVAKGNILGGVYAYVDNEDRLVLTNGNNQLLRIGKSANNAKWTLAITDTLPLTPIPANDSVVGLAPDWQGYVWFATANGLAGYADPVSKNVTTLSLKAPNGGVQEEVANSISTSPAGALISTTYATYLLGRDDASHTIKVLWREAYDRGPARKPGQLSWGTGSTPTFFGPQSGYEYVTIVDNASPLVNLLVYRTQDGSQVCKVPLFEPNNSGSENSPIGSGRSVIVASTYGYPYPALPANAPASQPSSAPFVGGIERVDVLEDDSQGCVVKWVNNKIRSSAVPKLSLGDKKIYTFVRQNPLSPDSTSTGILDNYYYTTIDSETGNIDSKQYVGTGSIYDTLQMAGLINQGVLLQGTITGVVRVRKA
ncbi:putative lipoprotein [Gamsiella multidivaricata]|uniref:putative lipoprotein n=1 Tax=Gamsiella multidivaricata TaxID=101098 RepID=UPI002220C968|nr:putative lipoprotein [Gamsiella multidivaricata]KAI7816580.1 putative lipoprotein [Gamsiella multidivaricata]